MPIINDPNKADELAQASPSNEMCDLAQEAEPITQPDDEPDAEPVPDTDLSEGASSVLQAAADPSTDPEVDQATIDLEATTRDFGALTQIPFIDLYNELSSAKKSISELQSSKAMMDRVGDLSLDTTSQLVNQMDAAEKAKLHQDVTDFYTRYPKMLHEGRRVEALCQALTNAVPEQYTKSTSFVSQSMVESAKRRIENWENANPMPINAATMIKRMKIIMTSYQDRTNYDFIMNKLRYPNQVLEIYKQFIKSPEDSMKQIDRVLSPVFNDEHMTKFRAIFTQLAIVSSLSEEDVANLNTNVARTMVFFMTYWLAHVYEKEMDSGRNTWVKMLIMNIYDSNPDAAIYDLAGGVQWVIQNSYILYTVLCIITSGQFTAKKLSQACNGILDDLLKVLNDSKPKLIEQFPGREPVETTTLAHIVPDLTVEAVVESMGDVDAPDRPEPDEEELSEDEVDQPTDQDEEEGDEADDETASESDDAPDADETGDADSGSSSDDEIAEDGDQPEDLLPGDENSASSHEGRVVEDQLGSAGAETASGSAACDDGLGIQVAGRDADTGEADADGEPEGGDAEDGDDTGDDTEEGAAEYSDADSAGQAAESCDDSAGYELDPEGDSAAECADQEQLSQDDECAGYGSDELEFPPECADQAERLGHTGDPGELKCDLDDAADTDSGNPSSGDNGADDDSEYDADLGDVPAEDESDGDDADYDAEVIDSDAGGAESAGESAEAADGSDQDGDGDEVRDERSEFLDGELSDGYELATGQAEPVVPADEPAAIPQVPVSTYVPPTPEQMMGQPGPGIQQAGSNVPPAMPKPATPSWMRNQTIDRADPTTPPKRSIAN